MEQFHLHQLFKELSSKLVCPKCNKKIAIHDIELKSSVGNTCIFEAECAECSNVMNISAMVQVNPPNPPNATAPLKNASKVDFNINDIYKTPITDYEINAIKTGVKQVKSFKSLFRSL